MMYDSAGVFRLLKKVLPEKKGPCEYCQMVNRNCGKAESLRDAVFGENNGVKIEYPFISLQVVDNQGHGIQSKGLTAKHCPMCGAEIER